MAFWGTSEDDVRNMLDEIEGRITDDINRRSDQAETAISGIWTHLTDRIETEISGLRQSMHALENELRQAKKDFNQKSELIAQSVDSLQQHWECNPVTQRIDDLFGKALQQVLTSRKEIQDIGESVEVFKQQLEQINDQKNTLVISIEQSKSAIKELIQKNERDLKALAGTEEIQFLRTATFGKRLQWLLTGKLPKNPEEEA